MVLGSGIQGSKINYDYGQFQIISGYFVVNEKKCCQIGTCGTGSTVNHVPNRKNI
jgi:hypothetical protein